MPLKAIVRKQTGKIYISGYVKGERKYYRAESDSLAVASQQASIDETNFLNAAWHGPKSSEVAHTFGEAVEKYLAAEDRSASTEARLVRLIDAVGEKTLLQDINEDIVPTLTKTMFKTPPSKATVVRTVVTPLKAIMAVAARRHWCGKFEMKVKRQPGRRPIYFTPEQAERLIEAATYHLKPFFTVMFCTGMRMSEGLYLDWLDVDLVNGTIILWPDRTKAEKKRVIHLPPRAIEALRTIPRREGMVFRKSNGDNYTSGDGSRGGQLKNSWSGARTRAQLPRDFTPHVMRHTWASWHYALNKDLLMLQRDGGWFSVDQVTCYAHLMHGEHDGAIRRFLGLNQGAAQKAA
jgi:integrase